MPSPKALLGGICLLSLPLNVVAAPVAELADFDQPLDGEVWSNGTHSQHFKRVRGDQQNPIPANFDTGNWPNIAEINCYIMLCLMNGQRNFQRNANQADEDARRRDSGANFVPFQLSQLASRHTSQIDPSTVSAEEFPWASTQQGGAGAWVVPASSYEQARQGQRIGQGYRQSNVAFGQWFRITFTGPHGLYCAALHATPPDRSVCNDDRKSTLFNVNGVQLANFVYKLVKTVTPFVFIHAAGPNKGKRSVDIPEFEIYAPDSASVPANAPGIGFGGL